MDKDSISVDSVDAFAVLENENFQRLKLTLKKTFGNKK